MDSQTIVLFGEAERGEYRMAYLCQSLPQLVEYLGNPPEDSHGLHLAVQALLYQRNLIFFRVREEGFSLQDYLIGLNLLQNQHTVPDIAAIGVPGVGNGEIIHAVIPICHYYHSILLTTERDFYDYITGQ